MGVRKWIMKQYWRLVQVRGIWNLFYGVLLLAIAYYAYIPYFYDMGALGPFVLAGILLTGFLTAGYLYDRVFVMWGPQQEVTVERDPFQFVPHPRDRVFWFPVYSTLLNASESIENELGLDVSKISETREYFANLEELRVEISTDIDAAIELRNAFIRKHPYRDIAGIDEVE